MEIPQHFFPGSSSPLNPLVATGRQEAEKDPYSYPWDVLQTQIDEIYEADRGLQEAELIVCTEPLDSRVEGCFTW